MKSVHSFGLVFIALTIAIVLSTQAVSQIGPPKNYVFLQPSTPGASQSGHAHLSGVVRAGAFAGNGSGLTNLSWSAITGIPVSFPPGGAASGDLAGAFPNPIVARIQGRPVGISAPTLGQFIGWDGAQWIPANNGGALSNLNASSLAAGIVPSARLSGVYSAPLLLTNVGNVFTGDGAGLTNLQWANISGAPTGLPPSGTASGDLSGTFPGPIVDGLMGRPITLGTPFSLEVLKWNGSLWDYSADSLALPFVGTTNSSTQVFFITNTNTLGGAAIKGASSSTSNLNDGIGVVGESAGGIGIGVMGESSGVTGSIGVYGVGTGIGEQVGVKGEVSNQSAVGVLGLNTSTSGNAYGGTFFSSSATGIALAATVTAGAGAEQYGVYASTNGSEGRSVYGISTRPDGHGIGGFFEAESGDGTGVFGRVNGSGGNAIGGWFVSGGTNGRAIYGNANFGNGVNFGVYGRSTSFDGRGVYGLATASAPLFTSYGVLGEAPISNAFAVYALGDMGASGVKPFRIDDPRDPENAYIMHYAAESPFPQNMYSGMVTTDGKGVAWVELPDYFSEINANFRYQLTIIDESGSDEFVHAKVSKRIQGNQFQIRTSSPNVAVSWLVIADRNDPYVVHRQPKDSVQKVGHERGRYQHPELYGKGANLRLNPNQEPIEPRRGRSIKR